VNHFILYHNITLHCSMNSLKYTFTFSFLYFGSAFAAIAFDYWTISEIWAPGYCAHSTCVATKVKPVFTIHGLWPSNKTRSHPFSCGPPSKINNSTVRYLFLSNIILILYLKDNNFLFILLGHVNNFSTHSKLAKL